MRETKIHAQLRALNQGDNEMIGVVRNKRMLAAFLSVMLILGTFGSLSVSAQGHYRRNHHSRTKGALVGGALGLIEVDSSAGGKVR